MRRQIIPIVLAAAVAVASGFPARAGDRAPRTLSLGGHGEVSAKPDIAVVRLGVEKQAREARAALRAASEAMTAVFAVLKERWNVAEKDMMTSGFSVTPQYVYPKKSYERKQGPKLVGYRVSNMLTVRVRDLKALGGILDDLVRSGSNRIGGISFVIDDPRPLRDEARRRAVRDALRKARLYAEEAGFELGPVLTMSERGGSVPAPVPMPVPRVRAMADKAMPVPVAAGERTVSADVSITWEIR